jgi:hypothetical protein
VVKRLDLTGWDVGVELEGTAICADRGSPVEIAPLLASANGLAAAVGLKGEVGAAQFELHTPVVPLRGAQEQLASWADQVQAFFPRQGIAPVFSSVSPFYQPGRGAPTVPVADLPRCAAILHAIDLLTREPGRGLRLFGETAGHNALQFHLRPPGWTAADFFGPVGVALVNAFAGRGLNLWFEAEHLSDPGARGLPNRHNREEFWRLAPGRGPTEGPYTQQSLVERWTSIPRLVRREGTEWHADLNMPTRGEVCRTGLYGTVWERVRPSPARADKPPTIEVRLWGSVRPHAVHWVLVNQVIPLLEEIELQD